MGNHNANGHGRKLAIPGQVQLSMVTHDNGMADPIPFQIGSPGGVELHIFGGLSKIEAIASRVAGGMTDGRLIDPVDEDVVRIAKLSVRIAKAIIQEAAPGSAVPAPVADTT